MWLMGTKKRQIAQLSCQCAGDGFLLARGGAIVSGPVGICSEENILSERQHK